MKHKWILLLCTILLFTGCWNYTELNNMAIITGLSIDKKGEEYEINLMVSNSQNVQSSNKEGSAQTSILTGTGKGILEAIREAELYSPKRLYIGHLSVIIASTEVAQEGLEKILDYLMREPESRKKFYFVIANKAKAGDVLKVVSPLEVFPSQNIALNIQSAAQEEAVTRDMTYSNFLSDILTEGKQPTLTSITVIGDVDKGEKNENIQKTDPDSIIKLGPIAIFKNDRLLGFASDDESSGINLFNNAIKQMHVTTKCDDSFITTNLREIKVGKKVKFENDQPKITLTMKATASIKEINCRRNLEDRKVILDIEKELREELESILQKGIDAAQKTYKSDVLGLGSLVYQKNPKYWYKNRDQWDDEIFPKLEIKLDMNINIKTNGSLEQSIRMGDI